MIVALVTDAQTVGKILVGCSVPVLAAVMFGRHQTVDLWRDLAREDRARTHGRMVRARRRIRRQCSCDHPDHRQFRVIEADGRLVYCWCCRCQLTLLDLRADVLAPE